MITNITDLAELVGFTSVPDLDEYDSRMSHRVYKDTACGAWAKLVREGNEAKGVLLGSIVEGSDAEFTCSPLMFPFPESDWDDAIDWLEGETSAAWHEANEGDDDDED